MGKRGDAFYADKTEYGKQMQEVMIKLDKFIHASTKILMEGKSKRLKIGKR